LINGVVTDDGAGKIQLTHAGQETMTWTGASGGSWDTSSTNFSGTVTGPDSFLQGDVVVFDTAKSPAETAVSVAGSGVTPASVSINDATGSFSFAGGSINGGGGITKTGAGKTILATDNTNTGTTTISEGTLQIGNGGTKGALGNGSVVNDGTLAVNKSSQTVLTGAISGTGVLRNDGTGRTIVPRDNSYAGGTVISKGTMEGRTAASFGTGTITLGDAAKSYLDMGLHPVVCRPREKIAAVPWKPFQVAAPTATDLATWWTRWPQGNIALVMGRGIFAVDLDGEGAEQVELG
jgi:autotransporter-associated beta strand protein